MKNFIIGAIACISIFLLVSAMQPTTVRSTVVLTVAEGDVSNAIIAKVKLGYRVAHMCPGQYDHIVVVMEK